MAGCIIRRRGQSIVTRQQPGDTLRAVSRVAMPPEMGGRGLRDAQHARGVAASVLDADTVLHLLLDANVIGKFENLIVVAPTLNGMLPMR
jgi:hypothetical protein